MTTWLYLPRLSDRATGWHETGRIYNDAGAIWRLKKDAATEYEILLPLQHNLGDYAERINDILKTLSVVENRDHVDIHARIYYQLSQLHRARCGYTNRYSAHPMN